MKKSLNKAEKFYIDNNDTKTAKEIASELGAPEIEKLIEKQLEKAKRSRTLKSIVPEHSGPAIMTGDASSTSDGKTYRGRPRIKDCIAKVYDE